MESPDLCLQCQSIKTAVYCVQCEGHLCESCGSSHTNIPVCKTHVVKHKTSICFLCYTPDIRYVCQECNGGLCNTCVATHYKIPACKYHSLNTVQHDIMNEIDQSGVVNDSWDNISNLEESSDITNVSRASYKGDKDTDDGSKEADKQDKSRPSVQQLVGKFDRQSSEESRTTRSKPSLIMSKRDSKNDDDCKSPVEDKIIPGSYSNVQEDDTIDALTSTMKSLFQKYDKNKNGVIDREELKLVFGNLKGQISESEVDRAMTIADTNEDGVIDYEEFMALFLKH